MAHMDGFTYGWVNPLLAYLVAVIGAALGLRCTVRALDLPPERRRGWLSLAACSIGCGIWTMHFIAMLGFSVTSATIVYSIPLTLASLLLAIVVVGIGVFYVGHRPPGTTTLLVGGVTTGGGVAVMHYLGMSAMELNGAVHYDPAVVLLSVAIAVLAATAALWMTLNIRKLWASLAAALVAGVAVTAMHYTAMQAVSVRLSGTAPRGGVPVGEFILPVAVGIVVFLTVAAITVAMSPREGAGEAPAAAPAERIQVDLFEGRFHGR
ncbi:MHYT domain-containing protein [Streptacidiphilus carbonis]|jgi:NO-binding membrane sensor protein with MHYT domain|uniref:MHYT domain-containing protein n=1 Tax=Streptacidiphilus carbonis TaxID=105422 RepID=UPI0005A8F0A2|nr:MHYT domain-containing protein [Streptacidiphilus carbonis]